MSPLVLPAFLAGVLTFLAPCTFPLVPGYLGFISGITAADRQIRRAQSQKKILLNALGFVLGFAIIFIFFGTAAGALGAILREHRLLVERMGGLVIILFGFLMLNILPFGTLQAEHVLRLPAWFHRGNPFNAILVGASFGASWTPCVGPILGSILTLAATSAGATQGAVLLGVYALGLGVPFLIIALFLEYFSHHMAQWSRTLKAFSVAGGVLLIVLGMMMLTNTLDVWMGSFYQLFGIVPSDALLKHL